MMGHHSIHTYVSATTDQIAVSFILIHHHNIKGPVHVQIITLPKAGENGSISNFKR